MTQSPASSISPCRAGSSTQFRNSVMRIIKSLNLTSLVPANIIRLHFVSCFPPFDAETRPVFRHDDVPISQRH